MAEQRSQTPSLFSGIIAFAVALLSSVVLVVIELMAALFTYFYLAIFQREWFGHLIGYARGVLNFCIGQIEMWFPSFTNAANATLIGELAPKSMLLLLIGLVVGALIRLVLWMLKRAIAGTSH
ncbi:MAG: hypothetical protein K0U74_01935 [Alphaproteobacteria bacterium]|nr:hypothetical protein [Alphaproteobacteria bacterium]